MNNPNQYRVVAVTGATGAIGKAIALSLAKTPGCEVVVLARDEAKAKNTVTEIISATNNRAVRYALVDVSRQASVQSLAESWEGPLHVLINNAAISPRRRQETPEGIELQFATNVLGYFWMTRVFTDLLERSAPARIVNVASYWAGDLDLTDLEFEKRTYRNGTAYRQSKQANRMLTVAFTEQLNSERVTINACHPGDVNSKLSNDLGFGGHETPAAGARTPVWLATDPVGAQATGKYFERESAVPCRFGQDPEAVSALFQACLAY
jgi:NAD(P)-dependent dehydrogenase (short-subunit alcohol dehydrogenase family)